MLLGIITTIITQLKNEDPEKYANREREVLHAILKLKRASEFTDDHLRHIAQCLEVTFPKEAQKEELVLLIFKELESSYLTELIKY